MEEFSYKSDNDDVAMKFYYTISRFQTPVERDSYEVSLSKLPIVTAPMLARKYYSIKCVWSRKLFGENVLFSWISFLWEQNIE